MNATQIELTESSKNLNMLNFESEWNKLRKIEQRARMLADLRDVNETKWQKLHDKLTKSPQWLDKCRELGIANDYNYGDIIC